ncbi:MAG: hypothetical protein KAX44_08240 [Candidatus Brocadiae bacterium]|nr:hypothetical protein [Candidatus Brocadiia bacterium]
MSNDNAMSPRDLDILRRLVAKKMEMAADPVNLECKAAWYAYDACDADARPMVLAEVGGVMNEVFAGRVYECQGQEARGIEGGLVDEIWQFEELRDDHVVVPALHVWWQPGSTDYGVQAVTHMSGTTDGRMGARNWEAPIKDITRDFDKLHAREFSIDREPTLARKDRLEQLFGDLIEVRLEGGVGWTQGLTWPAIDLIGLENLMMFMYDDADGLHRLMAFLRDDHIAFHDWMQAEGLLTLNNLNQYTGSGSVGYTHDLPQPDWREGDPVRIKDMWCLCESQETVGVGPEQFAEFIFPYQAAVAERFGKCYYGCCEPVHSRWHVIRQLHNLARVSVSPWCDQQFMAEAMGERYGFSRKPNPTMISTETFDEDFIRDDLTETLRITKAHGCPVEIVMKDVHTLNREPGRLARWVQLAREQVDEVYG